MKYSEQIKELRDKANIFEKSGCAVDGIVKAFREAADTIESLSAKLQAANMELPTDCGGWISCKERLPEESGYYLVIYYEWSNGNFFPKFDDTYVRRLHYQKNEQFTGWNYPKFLDKRAEDDMDLEVVAWQPLPEPYHEP